MTDFSLRNCLQNLINSFVQYDNPYIGVINGFYKEKNIKVGTDLYPFLHCKLMFPDTADQSLLALGGHLDILKKMDRLDSAQLSYWAAKGGHLHIIEYLKNSIIKDLSMVGASEEGHLHIVKYLNKDDIDISRYFCIAIYKMRDNLIQYYLDSDCPFNTSMVFKTACLYGNLMVISKMVLYIDNGTIQNSIFNAIEGGHLAITEFLLLFIIDGNDDLYTAYMNRACTYNKTDLIALFRKKGGYINDDDISLIAVSNKHLDLFKEYYTFSIPHFSMCISKAIQRDSFQIFVYILEERALPFEILTDIFNECIANHRVTFINFLLEKHPGLYNTLSTGDKKSIDFIRETYSD